MEQELKACYCERSVSAVTLQLALGTYFMTLDSDFLHLTFMCKVHTVHFVVVLHLVIYYTQLQAHIQLSSIVLAVPQYIYISVLLSVAIRTGGFQS